MKCTAPTSSFVSVRLCEQLAEHGLTRNTWAVWREYPPCPVRAHSELYLLAPGLDYAGLYADLSLPKGVHVPYRDTPAYTLCDMLRCIPGFSLQQVDAITTVISGYRVISKEKIKRDNMPLPDIAATYVLHLLAEKKFDPEILNQELLTKQPF